MKVNLGQPCRFYRKNKKRYPKKSQENSPKEILNLTKTYLGR